jgi:hypothetical protein
MKEFFTPSGKDKKKAIGAMFGTEEISMKNDK